MVRRVRGPVKYRLRSMYWVAVKERLPVMPFYIVAVIKIYVSQHSVVTVINPTRKLK